MNRNRVHIFTRGSDELEVMGAERIEGLLRTSDDGSGRISKDKLISLVLNCNVTPDHIDMATRDKSKLVLLVGVIANPKASDRQVKTAIKKFYRFENEPYRSELVLAQLQRVNDPIYDDLDFERALRLFKEMRKVLTI